jgi:hypothetical protein
VIDVTREVDEEYYATFWVVADGQTKLLVFEGEDPARSERLARRIAKLIDEEGL